MGDFCKFGGFSCDFGNFGRFLGDFGGFGWLLGDLGNLGPFWMIQVKPLEFHPLFKYNFWGHFGPKIEIELLIYY